MTKAVQTNAQIPRYGLYGEATGVGSDFVHIEDIDARSSPAGWHIKPHMHEGMFQILFVISGSAELNVDDVMCDERGSWVQTLPVGTVHGFRFSPNTDGYVLTISEQFLFDIVTSSRHPGSDKIINEALIIDCSKDSLFIAQLSNYFDLIKQELSTSLPGSTYMLHCLTEAVLLTILRLQLQDQDFSSPAGAKNRSIQEFRRLLDQNYHIHMKVEDYAKAMHISASTLNRLCNDLLGDNAKKIIQQRLLNEVQRRLKYTGEPLEQIALSLGYKDPAYFSRVFKKYSGITPSQYRQQHNIGNSEL